MTQGVADAARILAASRHRYDAAIDGSKWPVLPEKFAATGAGIVGAQPRIPQAAQAASR